jgi:hypothetical protein
VSHGERYTRKVFAHTNIDIIWVVDNIRLVRDISLGEPGSDMPHREWFDDYDGYMTWTELFIVNEVHQAPKVNWPRAVRWVFSRPFQHQEQVRFSSWYIAQAFYLRSEDCAYAFKKWSNIGGFLADLVHGEVLARGGVVKRTLPVISNGAYATLVKSLSGYEKYAADLNDESLGDICEAAVALMWIRMDFRAIRSFMLAALRFESVNIC